MDDIEEKPRDPWEIARRLGSGQEGVLTVGFSGSVMLRKLLMGKAFLG